MKKEDRQFCDLYIKEMIEIMEVFARHKGIQMNKNITKGVKRIYKFIEKFNKVIILYKILLQHKRLINK